MYARIKLQVFCFFISKGIKQNWLKLCSTKALLQELIAVMPRCHLKWKRLKFRNPSRRTRYNKSSFRLPNVCRPQVFFPEAPNVVLMVRVLYILLTWLMDWQQWGVFWEGKICIPSGFVKDMVLTNNFHEYGLTGNGIINTPRSGSNETTGKFSINRPGPSIDGKSSFAQRDLSGNQVKNGCPLSNRCWNRRCFS
jgi:hypothetical protein